jgi:hypothetical protein
VHLKKKEQKKLPPPPEQTAAAKAHLHVCVSFAQVTRAKTRSVVPGVISEIFNRTTQGPFSLQLHTKLAEHTMDKLIQRINLSLGNRGAHGSREKNKNKSKFAWASASKNRLFQHFDALIFKFSKWRCLFFL